jgi:hypothetical protein
MEDALKRAIHALTNLGENIELVLQDGEYNVITDSLSLAKNIPAIVAVWNERKDVWDCIKNLEDDEDYRQEIYDYFIEDFDLENDEIEGWIERKITLFKQTFELIQKWIDEFSKKDSEEEEEE